MQKINNICCLDGNINKKALILFKNEKRKRIISQSQEENSGVTNSSTNNNNSNNAHLNSNNSTSGPKIIKIKNKNVVNGSDNMNNNLKHKETSPRIPSSGLNKKRNYEAQIVKIDKKDKNFRKDKMKKLECLNDTSINQGLKKNSSFNIKKPKSISTDNNNEKDKINILNNGKKAKTKYNNYINNNQISNNKQNGSYTKIDKNKFNNNINNTCEAQKKNAHSLLRNKTAENYNSSKENKSNISNFDKRKNYNVPKVKIKSKLMEKEEKKEMNTNEQTEEERLYEKERLLNKLIQGQQNCCVRECKKLIKEMSQSKLSKDCENKRKYLEEYGVDIENFDEEDTIKNDSETNKNEVNKKKRKNKQVQLNEEERKNNSYIEEEKTKTINKNAQKGKVKYNINRNNNLNNMQDISNICNNGYNNNLPMLNHDNICANMSGSSEKNIPNDENMGNNHIYNNIKKNYNYDKDDMEQINDLYNIRKERRKQSVNTFEYFNKIYDLVDIDKNKKDYFKENMNNNNDSFGESFRKSTRSIKKDNINKNNNKENHNLKNNNINCLNEGVENNDTDADSGFNYNSKKNNRTKIEVLEYILLQKKRIKDEKEKNKKDIETKKLNKYFGLYRLQEGIYNNVNKNKSKINSLGNSHAQNMQIDNKNKKEKIQNEYYYGNKKSLRRKNSDLSRSTESSQSTIVDQNNYYLDLISSKNILSNTSNYIYNNGTNQNIPNNYNNINDLNIQVDTKDRNLKNPYVYGMNPNIMNEIISQEMNGNVKNNMNIKNNKLNGELLNKYKETMEKANQLFSGKIENNNANDSYNNNTNKYYINNENFNINNNLNNNNNIIIDNNQNKNNENNIQMTNGQINEIDPIPKSQKQLEEQEKIENKMIEEYKNDEIQNDFINNINENDNILNENPKKNINKNENKELDELLIVKEKEKEIEKDKSNSLNNDKNNLEIKDNKKNRKNYKFSQEDLENYYKIFISLEDYLNSLSKKNALNDIISYGDIRYTYKIGFESIISILKSYPFNLLKLIYQKQYYKDVLRQFVFPFLRRAFNNINLYIYCKEKFTAVNKVIEQIYRIVFLKRLNFYGEVKQFYKNDKKILSDEQRKLKLNNNINNINDFTKDINFNKEEKEKNGQAKKIETDKNQKEKLIAFIKILNFFFRKYIFIKLYCYFASLINKVENNENELMNKSNISSQKYNSYIYESFSENSSLTAYPNSEGSPRLHKVCELLEMQRKPQLEENNNSQNEYNNNLFDLTNSIQSIKSEEDKKEKKNENKMNDNNMINIDEKNLPSINNLIKSNEKIIEQKEIDINIIDEIQNSNPNNTNNINNKNEKNLEDDEGLNIPYEERLNNINNIEEIPLNNNINSYLNNNKIINDSDIKKNELNEEITELNNNKNITDEDKNDDKSLEKNYGNLPRKIEPEQYKKIEKKNDNNQNEQKYSGCVKKIEITNNFRLNMNSQNDISASKESNIIDWEFNNTNNSNNNNNSNSNINGSYNKININAKIENKNNKDNINNINNINDNDNNKEINQSLSNRDNRDKSPFSNNLLNSQKKDDLLNSSEFNSNIKEGISEENDININEEIEKIVIKEDTVKNNDTNEDNKEIFELNEKKSRNNNNDIVNKNEKKEMDENNKSNNNNSNNNSNQKQNNNSNNIIKSCEDNNGNIGLNLSNSFINKNNNISTISNNSSISNNNFRYNQNNNIEIDNSNQNKDNTNANNINVKISNDDDKMHKIFSDLTGDMIEKISNSLCEQIISNLLSEIKDKKKSLFKKKREINSSLNNSSSSLLVSQNSMSIGSHSPGRNYPINKNINLVNNNDSYQTISSVNNSQTEAIMNNSIFMRTIDEIKKEKTLNLYNDKIAPLLIQKIEDNINQNYDKIINNLKIPHKIDEAKMINGLMLKDRSLSITSKIRFCNDNIINTKFVEESILSDFDKTDKEIRNNDNILSDNYYDKILNKCVYDASNEIIEKQRKYGIIGEPLPWSIRTRDIDFKYKNNDRYSKYIFTHTIIKEIKKIIDTRMGLIAENYEYLDMDQLNQDRDKKFMESIMKELKDNEDYYQIFETQETYVKLSLSRIIMDQLLNEIVEILEHVQYSRKEPDKYQSKSIYACEDIPRLSFQPQTMENNYSGNLEGDGEGDESINQ